jgi:hypothetical protein
MWGLRRDQVEIHEENMCLFHNNVFLIGNRRDHIEIRDEYQFLITYQCVLSCEYYMWGLICC